jgi:hypothetical protein
MKIFIASLIAFIPLAGCQSKPQTSVSHSQESASTAAAYMCPMHHEMTSSKPDKCGKCGMMMEATQPATKPTEGGHAH